MRWTIPALLVVFALLAAGCQDNEARLQNQKLQSELEALKAKDTKMDPLQQLLAAKLAEGGGGSSDATDRKLNALAEDLRAGNDALKKELAANNDAQKKRVEELDDRLKKIANLEATITTLKASIEGLDGKVKGGNSEDVLKLQKEVLQKDAALAQEKLAREAAEAKLATAQLDVKAAQDAAKALQDQKAGLEGADISKHPMYQAALKEIRELKVEIEKMKGDIKNLDDAKRAADAELARLRGETPKGENPPVDTKKYDFTGTVVSVAGGARPGAPSNLLLKLDSGLIPPLGTVMTVLDAKGQLVCTVKVIRHYHMGDDPEKPVEEIGCATIDEKATRPVTKSDTVVWIKTAADALPKKEDDKGGAAGGN